ncbi:hypothetical protein RF11_14747 [Thelohanellus kitauei]|uniref:Vacuolar protein sorting/targeting protein 10 n=1 Tax=Thelohanellus kitauei TaxID=669202 RepID=A0A0C2MPF2_THEKT|nr:hypothetical protein RF11_14747 [Thelohanellus kitauei]
MEEFFYLHGKLYMLAWKNGFSLCLFTVNEYDQFIEVVCDLSPYDMWDHQCSFVINPHVSDVIYANIKKNDHYIRTHLKGGEPNCPYGNCAIELELDSSFDFIETNFPKRGLLKFKGTYTINGSTSSHLFVSLNGGKYWRMLDYRIEKLIISNGGEVMLFADRNTGRIMYSTDEGINWFFANISTNNFQDIISLKFPDNLAITGINYDQEKEIFTFLQFDFAHIICNMHLMIDSTCQSDDFETVHDLRYFGNCYQGKEVSYLKKKPSSLCFDNRTRVHPTIKSCPCSLEDFPWYHNFNHSKPNYYYNDNFCVLNPFLNITEPEKKCRDGGIPLKNLNGYESIRIDSHSWIQIIQIFLYFQDKFKECVLDDKGHYLPASHFNVHSLPIKISRKDPISYDVKSKSIYLYSNHTIIRYNENDRNYTNQESSLYRFNFDVVSMASHKVEPIESCALRELCSSDFSQHTDQLFLKYVYKQIELHETHGESLCQYTCDPLIASENFCYCIDALKTSEQYMCNSYDDDLCVGFKCLNGKCPLNNVRCNSVDDCEDGTDEANCEDSDLKIFSVHTYDKKADIVPSPFTKSWVLKLTEGDTSIDKGIIIGIVHNESSKEITTKIFHLNHLRARPDLRIYKKVAEFFYLHGMLYILAWKKGSELCLFTLDDKGGLNELVCSLFPYDRRHQKCSFLINPHVPDVIYANIQNHHNETITHVSFDNGKNFVPLQLKRGEPNCHDGNCGIELDFECNIDYIKYNFPKRGILKFKGTYKRKGSTSSHIFVSLNGGKYWRMLDSRIERLIISNGGEVMFGTERHTGKIMYSYDEGINWYFQNISTNNFQDITSLKFPDNLAIAAINYDPQNKICTFLQFDFSRVISNRHLMINRTCQSDDFETVHDLRYFGNCYQGKEVSYLKKKPSSLCLDNRTQVQPTIKSCPCSLEDFPWYQNCNHSKPNYYYNDNFCILNPFSNITEPVKQCRDGGIPLNDLNGYEAF